jgi:hypothetical protein
VRELPARAQRHEVALAARLKLHEI